ncbi:MAG: tricarballylate utilization 4Fe-4S protein TcuB [Pseudomonadota bacterium]
MSDFTIDNETMDEARRQMEICNACRYCEGYCSAFPALTRLRAFESSDITQIANLCHNCRGCYYACQYTAPHEFDINLPRALADVRLESWERFVWPHGLAELLQRHAWATTIATVLSFAVLFLAIRLLNNVSGEGFYAVLSHTAMVGIFLPAFLLPIISIAIGLFHYWKEVGGTRVSIGQIVGACKQAANMKNLDGGHGEGCNFENEDRYSSARRYAHQAVMYGFLLCFASTSIATVLHYIFNMPAPYPLFSFPKLFGISGGILLTAGCGWMLILKSKADNSLSSNQAYNAECAFIALLGFVGLSGLLLYWLGDTQLMPSLLAIHLGAVLAFFLLTPFTKMAHGFFRLAALIREEQLKSVG